jgi:hypothetical protein
VYSKVAKVAKILYNLGIEGYRRFNGKHKNE